VSIHTIEPGFIVLQGDRLEWLSDAVLQWLREHPLQPLEDEIFLVQSNGIAEWLQWTLARHEGICASVKVMLPGRFLWDSYGRMLGRAAVAARSPLDKAPLTWRLLRLLPTCLAQNDFAPLRHYLAPTGTLGAERRWQMAAQIADLFDQYQVYRGDWLADWAQGGVDIRDGQGQRRPIPVDQRWQSALWQAIQNDLRLQGQSSDSGRAEIHRAFITALQEGREPVQGLPRRVVLFGAATLPEQSLSALAALGQRIQVILAVPNPCQYHWADIISGRELLRRESRRQRLRHGRDLSVTPPEDLHSESNSLLAQWGRQGRDFLNMLDQMDDTPALQQTMGIPRIDLFSEDTGDTLLRQLQVLIRDQETLHPEHVTPISENDDSVVFHIAHSALRETQILHDQLLDRFAQGSLQPRDVIVMVPEIGQFAPLIRATFDQYGREDPRHIPYHIVDMRARDESPLLLALEWLLQLPEQRCQHSEIRDLLHCPALRQRFDLENADLPIIAQWLEGSGWRWGLSEAHRASLGMTYCGNQNSGDFALQRLSLGYANGDDSHFEEIEAYGEVGGLNAVLLGPLSQLLEKLQFWQRALQQDRRPTDWGETARSLLQDFFSASNPDEAERLQQLDTALQQWQEDCQLADFAEPLALSVFRGHWLEMLDSPELHRSFLGGGVTFCTLLPMRAVPYPMVCLLGMNESDYPRRNPRLDFDLMTLPGMARPGDRSRRDDDRYLMLEALLAARQTLYVSWVGRDQRNNERRQPSLLITQLQDAIRSAWPESATPTEDEAHPEKNALLRRITHAYPLQPFSAEYLHPGRGLHTWAREWYPAPATIEPTAPLPSNPEMGTRNLNELLDFFRWPPRAFYRQRLRTFFSETDDTPSDDEPFDLDGLETYTLLQALLESGEHHTTPTLAEKIAAQQRSGAYPMGPMASMTASTLFHEATPILKAWQAVTADWQVDPQRHALQVQMGALHLNDWLPSMRRNTSGALAFVQCRASRLLNKQDQPEPEKLAELWLQQLLAAHLGIACQGILVGRDALIRSATSPENATQILENIGSLWEEGLTFPLPVTLKTAIALLQQGKPALLYDGDAYQGRGQVHQDLSLARDYPDFATLSTRCCAPRQWYFADYAEALYRPFAEWLTTLQTERHP